MSVSYTHLDVYKRQNWESVEGKPDVLIYKEGEAYKAVSYTHLDVYKRQLHHLPDGHGTAERERHP